MTQAAPQTEQSSTTTTGLQDQLQNGLDTLANWAMSPAAYAQFGLLLASFALAWFATKFLTPRLKKLLTPGEDDRSPLAGLRNFAILFLPLLLPLLAFLFTAAAEGAIRASLGEGAVIALGKRIFIFIAVWILVFRIIHAPFLKTICKWTFVPIAGLYALGLLPFVQRALAETPVGVPGLSIQADRLVVGIIAALLLVWVGRWSNEQSGTYIRSRENIRPSIRELAAKTSQLIIYGLVAFILIRIFGLDVTALTVLGGAIGVGIGFGLQKIASNFISGIILLLEGQATVGDFVELDGGEAGRIVKMMARATILETFDGKWIVVPNEDFIVTRVVNYSDSGSANRYSVDFTVSYDTDINKIPDIVGPAVLSHPDVLSEPELPDVELVAFGDSGVEFCVEFWVNGLDDGPNKYSSDVLVLIWNALKDNNISIPYPQREVRILGEKPASL